MTNDALSEASWVLEEIGQVLKPVIRTEPADQLAEQMFPNKKALEHALALVSTLSDPSAQHEILQMECWNSDSYEDWLGKYGVRLAHYSDPVPEGLEPYMPVDCPHGSPSPSLYGPPGGVRRERLQKALGKAASDSESSSENVGESSEHSGEEQSDEMGTSFYFFIFIIFL